MEKEGERRWTRMVSDFARKVTANVDVKKLENSVKNIRVDVEHRGNAILARRDRDSIVHRIQAKSSPKQMSCIVEQSLRTQREPIVFRGKPAGCLDPEGNSTKQLCKVVNNKLLSRALYFGVASRTQSSVKKAGEGRVIDCPLQEKEFVKRKARLQDRKEKTYHKVSWGRSPWRFLRLLSCLWWWTTWSKPKMLQRPQCSGRSFSEGTSLYSWEKRRNFWTSYAKVLIKRPFFDIRQATVDPLSFPVRDTRGTLPLAISRGWGGATGVSPKIIK